MAKTFSPDSFSSGETLIKKDKQSNTNLSQMAFTVHKIRAAEEADQERAKQELFKLIDIDLKGVVGADRDKLIGKKNDLTEKMIGFLSDNEKKYGIKGKLLDNQKKEIMNDSDEIRGFVSVWSEWQKGTKEVMWKLMKEEYKDLDNQASIQKLNEINHNPDVYQRYQDFSEGKWMVETKYPDVGDYAKMVTGLPPKVSPEVLSNFVENDTKWRMDYKGWQKRNPDEGFDKYYKQVRGSQAAYENSIENQKKQQDLQNSRLRGQQLINDINNPTEGKSSFKILGQEEGYQTAWEKPFAIGSPVENMEVDLSGDAVLVTPDGSTIRDYSGKFKVTDIVYDKDNYTPKLIGSIPKTVKSQEDVVIDGRITGKGKSAKVITSGSGSGSPLIISDGKAYIIKDGAKSLVEYTDKDAGLVKIYTKKETTAKKNVPVSLSLYSNSVANLEVMNKYPKLKELFDVWEKAIYPKDESQEAPEQDQETEFVPE